MTKKVKVIFDEGNFGPGEFKIFSFEKLDEFPKNSNLIGNLAVVLFNSKDLDLFKKMAEDETIDDNDFRFVLRASLDGTYLELTDLAFAYLKKNIENVFIYDPCGELEEKWNVMTYQKK